MAGYDIPDLIDDQELEDLFQDGNFVNSEYSDWLNHASFELDFGTEGVPPVPPDHYYPTPEDMNTYGNVQVENLTASGMPIPAPSTLFPSIPYQTYGYASSLA
ncbi:hypothetical protein PG990_008361 [Apiospora arundinis]